MDQNVASTRELHWGLSHIANIEPQKKRFTAFAVINENLYCSSDGSNTYFWNENEIVKTIELGAMALHYIKSLNHVIASIKNSTHLHFIWIHDNYSIIVHPLSFSIRTITSLHYFPNSQTLITAGQGLTFSKMKIPHFACSGAFTRLIDFEKVAELYPDEIFTKVRTPLFIESEDSIAISIDKSLFIHSFNGNLIGKMENLMPGTITCLSYFEPHKLIVIGDEFGNVSFVEYGQFFTSIRTSLSNNVHLLLATLFDRNFLVTIGLDQSLTLINVKTEYRIQTIKLKSEIINAETTQNKILAFSSMECLIYNVSIFTQFFANLTNNAFKIERHLQPQRPSLLVCLQKDSIISTFSPKTGKKYCEFASSSLSSEVIDFILKDNTIFFQFKHGNFMKSKLSKKESIISLQNDDLNQHSIKVPASVSNVVQIIQYNSDQQGESLLALTSTGHIYSFSVEKRKLVNSVYIGCSDIICGTFSSVFKIFIISTKTKIIVVDSEKLTVTKRIEGGLITVFYIEDALLFSGDANGYIELRDLPSLEVKAQSRLYNGCHTDNGSRKPLALFNSYSDIPHAVKYLSFLKRREILISVSNQGEVFLWTMNLFPYCHIRFSYEMLAATFFDSNGSLIVSSFDSLFVIPYTYIFDQPIQDEIDDLQENVYDEFNTFEEKEEIKKKKPKKVQSSSDKDINSLFDVYERFQYNDNQAYIQKDFQKQKASFWMEPENDVIEPQEAPFEDLIVDLESIPKGHFVSFDEANNRRKTLEKNPKPKREFKKRKKSPVVQETPNDEEEKKQPRMPKTPPILTNQNPRKNRHSSSQKSKKKNVKKQIAPKKEPETPKPVENPIQEPASKPKPKNYFPAYLQQNNQNNISLRRSANNNINQTNQSNSKPSNQLGTKPVFTVEARKRPIQHPNSELSTKNDKEDFNNTEKEEENEKINDKQRDTNIDNREDDLGVAFRPKYVEFVEPKFEGQRIPTVTMEELDDYMSKNTIFLRISNNSRPGSARRNKRSAIDSSRGQRYPKVSRVPRNETRNTRVNYSNIF